MDNANEHAQFSTLEHLEALLVPPPADDDADASGPLARHLGAAFEAEARRIPVRLF